MVQLDRAHEAFDAAGAALALIGQAGARQAAHFRRKLGLRALLLADADRVSYRAAGAVRGGAVELLGPRSVANAIKHMARSRVVQGRPVGDVTQLGGAMVIAPGGVVAFHRMAEHAGDNVDPAELLAAARAAASQAA